MNQLIEKIKNIIKCKSRHCKHQNGCIYDTLKQLLKQVKYGLIISCLLQLLKSLKSLMKGVSHAKKSFTPQYFSIILFLCLSTTTLRTVKCSLRNLLDTNHPITSLVAGFAAGYVGTKTLNKDYWYVLLMFISSRILGAIHEELITKGYLKKENKKYHYFVLFFLTNIVHCYGYFIQPDILKPDMYNLYERMSVLTPNQKRWHMSSLIHKRNQMIATGIPTYTNSTQNHIRKLKLQIYGKK